MSLRKQTVKDASGFDGNTQEDDDKDEFSLSLLPPALTRDKRRRERENKSKPTEMTEEEMMDLALRLSEQEASVTASRLQQEEEAVMKAIQESMVGQTQACPPSQSQSLLTDAEASLRLCSRRKLMYSNGRKTSAINQGALEDECPPETDMNQEAKETGDKYNNQNKKRKRKEGSPLPEMPDLSQSQKIYSQASPCSSDSLSAPLDSQQSSDSTQIDDCQLHKSPVFPLTDCRATVCVPRLSQDLLETCKSSGFVLCSQDSWISTQKSQPKSLTFPKSPSYFTACPKSPVFSDTDQGDDVETELNPECDKSPVFGNSAQKDTSPSACKPQVCENSGFMFSSQESLTSTVRSTSCRPKSPVFPSSPGLPKNITFLEKSAICNSPVFPESNRGQTGESHRCSSIPVFGKTGQEQKIHPDTKNPSMVPSAAELRGSNCELNSSATWDPPQSPRQEGHSQDIRFTTSSKSDADKELNEISKDCNSAETKLTSDMTLIWSDEDDDNITPVGSPSPVFPEERSIHQADSQAASSNHVTAASPDTTVSNCRKQLCTTEQKTQLVGSPGTANGALTPCGKPTGGSTVHYYWGVPFCPRGLDPDSYTQMILAQMEVYEKSLKEAQRSLLRKAEWGEPILPQPEKSPSPESQAESPEPHIPRRLGLRLRGKNQRETGDNSPAEAEEEEEDKKAEEEEKETETENKEEEKNEGGEDEEDTDDCELCPETQLSDDNDGTQDLTMSPNNRAQLQPESPELPEVEMILQDGSPAVDQKQVEEEMDVDVPEDRKTESSISVCRSVGGQNVRKQEKEEDSEDPDVEEVKDPEPQRSASPEPKLAAIPRSPENIDCPICQGSFHVTEIEIHAAYCDGEVAVVDERRPEANSFQTSLKPRRKRTRRADVTDEDTNEQSLTGRNQEKCYVCQKAVPLKDYSHHTEFCIQRQASKTDTKGNLLSALEQTESMDSVAGPSKLQPGEVIDLRDEDEEDDGVSAFRISNSPIRSFTPISEATDCLIDFKKQQRAKKPSRRRR